MDFLLLLKGIVIAIVQGITEFLPISSTGHMILVGHLIGFEGEFARLYEIVIQLGTILAVPVLFRKRFFDSLRHLWPGEAGFMFWSKIAVACVPAGLLGLLTKDLIDQYLMYPFPVAVALVVGALLILVVERVKGSDETSEARRRTLDNVSFVQAFGIGIFQCLSLWSGFSRSASTIIGGRLMGLSGVVAAEFSFFLAIPMMFLTSVYALLKTKVQMQSFEWLVLGTGFVVAFVVALVVVDGFVRYLKTKPMTVFAWYRLVVGLGILVLLHFGWL